MLLKHLDRLALRYRWLWCVQRRHVWRGLGVTSASGWSYRLVTLPLGITYAEGLGHAMLTICGRVVWSK